MAQTHPPGSGSAKSKSRKPRRPGMSDVQGGQPAGTESPAHDPRPAPQPPDPPGGNEPLHDPPPSPMQDRPMRDRMAGHPNPSGPTNPGGSLPGGSRGEVLFDENESGR